MFRIGIIVLACMLGFLVYLSHLIGLEGQERNRLQNENSALRTENAHLMEELKKGNSTILKADSIINANKQN